MELGWLRQLMEWQREGQSLTRLQTATDAARDHGFDTIFDKANFVFSTPWLDGLTVHDPALAAFVAERPEPDRVDLVARGLRIGLLALQDAGVTVNVDVVPGPSRVHAGVTPAWSGGVGVERRRP